MCLFMCFRQDLVRFTLIRKLTPAALGPDELKRSVTLIAVNPLTADIAAWYQVCRPVRSGQLGWCVFVKTPLLGSPT